MLEQQRRQQSKEQSSFNSLQREIMELQKSKPSLRANFLVVETQQ